MEICRFKTDRKMKTFSLKFTDQSVLFPINFLYHINKVAYPFPCILELSPINTDCDIHDNFEY